MASEVGQARCYYFAMLEADAEGFVLPDELRSRGRSSLQTSRTASTTLDIDFDAVRAEGSAAMSNDPHVILWGPCYLLTTMRLPFIHCAPSARSAGGPKGGRDAAPQQRQWGFRAAGSAEQEPAAHQLRRPACMP